MEQLTLFPLDDLICQPVPARPVSAEDEPDAGTGSPQTETLFEASAEGRP
ncbi:hypothetical protein [Streptomyces sp. Ac-502]